MAAGKPPSINFQFPTILKERLQSREQLEVKNQKGLEPEEEAQMPERTSHDFKARNNHDFLKKEAPDEDMDDLAGEQLNHTESHKAMQFLCSGQRNTQLREHVPWENPKAFLGTFEGAVNAYRRSRGISDLRVEAEEEDTKVEVTKMEDYLEEEEDFLGENAFTKDIQRTLFREFRYLRAEGPRETCSRLWYLCYRWLKPERHTKEQILELVILEQFLAILPLETQSWVKGGCPQTCDQAVALAEDFLQRRQESRQLEQEDQVPIQEVGLNVHSPEQTPYRMKENASCPKAKKEVENEINSQTADKWITESKEEKPSIGTIEPVKLLETSWGNSPWSKETSEVSPSSGESDKVKKTYLTPGVDALFPYLEESGEVNQNTVVKRRRRTRGEKVCGVCGRSFNRTAVLVAHQRTHTGEKPFMCKDCGKCFSLKSTLVAHERTHTGERPYSCSQCGKSFTASSHLTRHYRIHIGEKPFNCLQCDKSFSRKAQLVNHEKVHTREKPYKCSECGQTFNRSSSLMIHESSHTGIKPFKCPDCDKSFKRACHLVKHQRVHTGERPYTCSECGKSFGQREILMVHQRIHTGEKPFKCTVCGKCFGDRSVLVRHQKVHTGERPYECTTCGKRFSHWAVLVRHQKIHTRDALNAQRVKEEETLTSRQIP